MSTIQLQPGDRVSNYLLDEKVGVGSFGEVWKAHHHVFPQVVAVKIPTDPRYVRHLQREGTAIHGLQDPHIVRALDMDPYADPPYLIVEYVDGPSLRELIRSSPGGLPVETIVAVLYGVLSGLEVAHAAGLVHRDIKPENILIGGGRDLSSLTPAHVRVADFGLGYAGDAADGSMLQSGSIAGQGVRLAGTLAYMSPEQRDGQPVDGRSDLYSLGIVLHEMLTGVLPQGHDLPSVIRADVPRWLERVFEQCYTRRDRRFASAGDVKAEIERYWPGVATWTSSAGRQSPRVRRSGDRIRCSACDGIVDDVDQFCIHCGEQLVECVPRCPTCHAFVGVADNFCILCGTDLRGERRDSDASRAGRTGYTAG